MRWLNGLVKSTVKDNQSLWKNERFMVLDMKNFLVVMVLLLCSSLAAAEIYPPLRESHDPELQAQLEKTIAKLGMRSAVKKKTLAVALVDVTDPTDPHMASVNGNSMLYAASLPKIAILLGVCQRAADGEIKLDKKTLQQLNMMIRHSNNASATAMLRKAGKRYLAKLLQSPRYRLYDRKYNGGLWVGKEYSKRGSWRRDPLHNLSHGATAIQVARYLYLLETGRLVSPSYSHLMKGIMGNPAIKHKFVKGLKARPGSKIFRKSGSWRKWHADSAIVERDGRTYIAVALAADSRGGHWLPKLIVGMDDIIFARKNVPSMAALQK